MTLVGFPEARFIGRDARQIPGVRPAHILSCSPNLLSIAMMSLDTSLSPRLWGPNGLTVKESTGPPLIRIVTICRGCTHLRVITTGSPRLLTLERVTQRYHEEAWVPKSVETIVLGITDSYLNHYMFIMTVHPSCIVLLCLKLQKKNNKCFLFLVCKYFQTYSILHCPLGNDALEENIFESCVMKDWSTLLSECCFKNFESKTITFKIQSFVFPRRRTGFDSRWSHPRISTCGNLAGRCRWSAGFLGDLPFPPPLNSGAAPYSSRITLIGFQDLDVKSHPNLLTRSLNYTVQASCGWRRGGREVTAPAERKDLCEPRPGRFGGGGGGGHWGRLGGHGAVERGVAVAALGEDEVLDVGRVAGVVEQQRADSGTRTATATRVASPPPTALGDGAVLGQLQQATAVLAQAGARLLAAPAAHRAAPATLSALQQPHHAVFLTLRSSLFTLPSPREIEPRVSRRLSWQQARLDSLLYRTATGHRSSTAPQQKEINARRGGKRTAFTKRIFGTPFAQAGHPFAGGFQLRRNGVLVPLMLAYPDWLREALQVALASDWLLRAAKVSLLTGPPA
ncbi:hypothetical protein PR048_007212, partial [Dryococelus australis]